MTDPCPVKRCRSTIDADRQICPACTTDLTRVLAEMPAAIDTLTAELARQRGKGIGSGSRASERPLMFDVRSSQAATELRLTLVWWVRDLAEHHPALGWPADDLTAMARWLHARLPMLLTHPAAAHIVEEITTASDAIWRVVDNPPARMFLGPCECGADLYARDGAAVTVCTECGAGHDAHGIRVRLTEALDGQLVTAAQFAGLAVHLGLIPTAGRDRLRQRVNVWATRSLVQRHGNDDGEPTYPYRELEALLAANPTNPAKGPRMATHPRCGKTWTGTRREHCPVCCETFNSQTAGDMHRAGDHQDGRRCLTVDEMTVAGMVLGDDGIWRSMADSRRDRSRQSDERAALGSIPSPTIQGPQILDSADVA